MYVYTHKGIKKKSCGKVYLSQYGIFRKTAQTSIQHPTRRPVSEPLQGNASHSRNSRDSQRDEAPCGHKWVQ